MWKIWLAMSVDTLLLDMGLELREYHRITKINVCAFGNGFMAPYIWAVEKQIVGYSAWHLYYCGSLE